MCSSRGGLSQTIPNKKSIQFLVKDELFDQFQRLQLQEQLAYALSEPLNLPKENITSYRARKQLPYDKNTKRIHVAHKALITIIVSGVETEEIKKHVDMIINVLYTNADVPPSQVEIVQILPSNSCLLVIRLPGLAMVRLIIAFLHPLNRPTFLHQLKRILPSAAFEVKFGFASLPYFSTELPLGSGIPPFAAGLSFRESLSFRKLSSLSGSRYLTSPSSTAQDFEVKIQQSIDTGNFIILHFIIHVTVTALA